MALSLWIWYAIFILLPFLIAGSIYIVLLPGQARIALPQFAQMAVQEVEQVHRNESNEAKKGYAITSVVKYFRMHLFFPVPPHDRIEAAIESAVFKLPPTEK